MLSERNREIVAQTARVLGRHFITLDPETIVVRELDGVLGRGWRVPCQLKMDLWEPFKEAPDYQSFMEVVLPAMHGTLLADDLSPHMHFVIQHGERRAAYVVQEDSLLMLGRNDAVRRITEQLAAHLYEGLAKAKVGTRS